MLNLVTCLRFFALPPLSPLLLLLLPLLLLPLLLLPLLLLLVTLLLLPPLPPLLLLSLSRRFLGRLLTERCIPLHRSHA